MERLDCCVQGQGPVMVQYFIKCLFVSPSILFSTADIFATKLGVLMHCKCNQI